MERFTQRTAQGKVDLTHTLLHSALDGASNQESREVCAAMERLAQYEDIGLDPEGVDALRKREQFLEEMLMDITCGDAVSYIRLAELALAEKNGRLAILPSDNYCWRIRGDSLLCVIQPNCHNTSENDNKPLTPEELRAMGGQPYWHVGLQKDSPAPHWSILDPIHAKCVTDLHYGSRWLAYRHPVEKDGNALYNDIMLLLEGGKI